MARSTVTVIGSLNVDLVAHAARLPSPGETVAGKGFETVAGGKGANQALAAARAGAQTRMIGAVGDDHYADVARANLEAAGVDLSGVRNVEGETGIAQIAVDETGENTIIIVAGANGQVAPAQALAAIADLQAGDIAMLQMEVPAETGLAAVRAARRAGIRTIFNTAPFTDEVPEIAASADIVICNETEFDLLAAAEGLSGSREDAARALAERNGQTLVVTLGKDGAFIADDTGITRVASIAVEAVDAVGAGDTFCGYLAAGIADGRDIADAARTACAAAALACTRRGAQTGIPEKAAVGALA